MLLLLHGARKNVGDFLIRARATQILNHLKPKQDLEYWERNLPVPKDLLNAADAFVICGGPAYYADFYPRILPHILPLLDVAKPIMPLALGWSGQGDYSSFRFSRESGDVLRAIHGSVEETSVRDEQTLQLLNQHEIRNVACTGCVVWYQLADLGRQPIWPKDVKHIVFTPPSAPDLRSEAIDILRRLGSRFRKAAKSCVFHRGILPGQGTTMRSGFAFSMIATQAHLSGFRVVDASRELASIDFYRKADLHVGYRVHAHLAFLSQRRPSLLIAEDGRGEGQQGTLGDEYLMNARSKDVAGEVLPAVDRELAEGFPSSSAAVRKIDATWNQMVSVLRNLPD